MSAKDVTAVSEWYDKNKKRCLYCGQYIPLNDMRTNDYKQKKFCNQSCAASYNNQNRNTKRRKDIKYCLNCGKETSSRSDKYCSNECQRIFQYKQYIEKWQAGIENGCVKPYGISGYIRRYLFEKYNNKCSRCGWGEVNPFTGKIPLEIHHKDGDYTNNVENNLELLCPNCHSLTATYKNANVGNGRKDRKKYTQ